MNILDRWIFVQSMRGKELDTVFVRLLRKWSNAQHNSTISAECLLGRAHFLGCPKIDCTCCCHEFDGEHNSRIEQRHEHRSGKELV